LGEEEFHSKGLWIGNLTFFYIWFNPLNTDLNSICHLLALLGAHHVLHVSGLRVNIDMRDILRLKVSSALPPHSQLIILGVVFHICT
jgi:hypothetical protein